MSRVARIFLLMVLASAVFVSCGSPAASTLSTPISATVIPATAIPATAVPATAMPTAVLAAAAPTAGTAKQDAGVLNTTIDVGGRSLYILCTGAGSPTVILDNGLDADLTIWSSAMLPLQRVTRVCAYDRAGVGKSDPAPKPRTSKDMVQDLHTLLTNAKVPGPYVLVGWSIAGFNVRVYASQYPADVVGMVLVEASHPDQFERRLAALPPPTSSDSDDLKGWREYLSKFPSDLSWNDEGMDIATSATQVRATGSLGAMPLVVLSRGLSDELPGLPKEVAAKQEQIWSELQKELAGLSTNSSQMIADVSHHCIPCDQPDMVAKAIKKVVRAVQSK